METVLADHEPLIRRRRPFLDAERAGKLCQQLRDELNWHQPEITLYGRRHPVPRLQVWQGDPEAEYRYSGLVLTPEPWHPLLAELRRDVEHICDAHFNSVLVNLYRDGQDSMGWHADDEPELGPAPRVASISLGAVRDFALRRRGETRMAEKLQLEHNELLLMEAGLQARWEHSLPRRKRVTRPRLNLTFRWVRPEYR